MFGYVKAYRPDLRIREYEAYRGVYCGICRTMGKCFGLRSRLVLGYDSVFVAMLAADVQGERLCFRKCRCPVHPFEKRACANMAESLRFASAAYLILLWHKLCDDVQDSRSIRAFFTRLWLRKAYKRAAAAYPEAAKIAQTYMEEQQRVEKIPSPSMDVCSDPSARAMASLFELLSDAPSERRVLNRLGYMLGRWVYFMDAADDYAEDVQKGRFNAFARALPEEICGSSEQLRAVAQRTLDLTRNEMETAYSLLPEGMFAPVLQNIIQQGLPAETARVLDKTHKKGIRT